MDNLLGEFYDAIIERIDFLTRAEQVEIYASIFERPITKSAQRHVILFHCVTEVSIPFTQPWGPSFSINTFSNHAGTFKIQMQSGDVIVIKAKTVTVSPINKT